jgi:TatD DNase family protein
MPTELIDIGANLAHDSFDADRDAVLERAESAGICQLVVTGSSFESNVAALQLAHRLPARLFCTAGVHPHHAADYDDRTDAQIRALAADPACVAIGECGLDYFRNYSPRDAQLAAFEAQLQAAADCGKPVFLHQRDAHDDFVAMLEPRLASVSRAVAHCFTGDAAALDAYLEMDLYIGITGWICDERRGRELYRLASRIPDDRLMIETDAPYLLPRTLRPKPGSRRNEPAFLAEVLRVLAQARGQHPDHVAEITTRNARLFFGLDPL